MPHDDADVFAEIYGQNRAKVALRGALRSTARQHVLLVGPPGCGKSEFLKALERHLPDVRYLDGDAVTQAELKDVFADDHAIIAFDEFDELDYKAYRALSTPLEDGRVIKDTAEQSYDVQIDTQVVAACNSTERIPGHILSRFSDVELEPYSEADFVALCTQMLPRAVEWVETDAHAERVAAAALDVEGETDPRVARNLARLASGPDDLETVVAAMQDPNADLDGVELRPADVAATREEVLQDRLVETLACEIVSPGACDVPGREAPPPGRVERAVARDVDRAIEARVTEAAIEEAVAESQARE